MIVCCLSHPLPHHLAPDATLWPMLGFSTTKFPLFPVKRIPWEWPQSEVRESDKLPHSGPLPVKYTTRQRAMCNEAKVRFRSGSGLILLNGNLNSGLERLLC
jgi:hypothetical protein